MEWRKLTVHSDPENEEIVSNILMETGAQGVVINGNWQTEAATAEWDFAEGLPDVPYSIEAFYGAQEDIEQLVRDRLSGVLPSVPRLEAATVDDEDWKNNWKKYFGPVRAADRIVVKPTWCEYKPYADDLVVEIDPGMAFGAGGHETTRMSIKLIEQFLYNGDTVVDVGSGSGVLAIAAAKLGAGRVFALEVDPTAVQVAAENVQSNAAHEKVTVLKSDLLSGLPETIQADLMVANIVADVIIRLAPDICGALRPNGMFLCSGIVEDRLGDVIKALEHQGLRIIALERDGEWCALACKNKG